MNSLVEEKWKRTWEVGPIPELTRMKEITAPVPGPNNEEYRRRAAKVLLTGMPHFPFCIGKAEGSWYIDVDGNKYIDMVSAWATNNVGNCHPRVLKAAIEALKQYGFLIGEWSPYPPMVELAEKLREILPPKITRVVYEISGTEAAEGVVQHAIAAKKRPLIISFVRCYSGFSIGAKNIGSLGAYLKSYLEAFHGGVIWVPYPISYRIPGKLTQEEYADWILHDFIEEEILKYVAAPDRIAGVYFEPMISEGGHWIPPDNFLPGLRKLADKYDWLLIDDEVLVGFGRTGKWFGIEHWNVPIDLMTLGKGLSGGIEPIAGTCASEEVMQACKGTIGTSGGTYAGSPAGCAAALANIEVMQEERLPERAAKLGEKMVKRMEEWVDEYEIVGDVRGKGLWVAVEIVKDKKTETADIETAGLIWRECIRNGVISIWDDFVPVIRYLPPLTIEEELLDKATTVLEEAIKKVQHSK